MKLILLIATIAAMLVGCDAREEIKPTRDTKDFSVRLNFVPAADITSVCTKLGTAYEANGCNAFYTPQNFCDIYVVAPSSVSDDEKMRIIGHELMHCRYGAYHE